jgi:hypothetical protein
LDGDSFDYGQWDDEEVPREEHEDDAGWSDGPGPAQQIRSRMRRTSNFVV